MSSVVGFIQDVVGGGDHHHHHYASAGSSVNASSSSQMSGGGGCDLREHIEWLHFEPFHLLSQRATSLYANTPYDHSNIILVTGYKTGFSVWSIDVITSPLNVAIDDLFCIEYLFSFNSSKTNKQTNN